MTAAAELTTILPMLADTLTSRCRFYRRTCRLDARIRPELQDIVAVAGDMLGAITMPAELAARVRLHMQQQGIRVGPIISHPRSKRWSFLCRPDIPDDMETFGRLFRAQITVARHGAAIALPSPGRRSAGFRCWSHAPVDAYLPSGVVVLAAVDACGGLSRRARRC